MRFLLVGVGGCIGSMARYGTSYAVQRAQLSPIIGTLVVNVAGCLIVGVLSYAADQRNAFTPEMRAFLFAGLLGGFTTFSAFGNDTFALLRADRMGAAALNVTAQVLLGLGAIWLGRTVARLCVIANAS
jgi:CrcB protein